MRMMYRKIESLSELSLKELWELFPITLTEHKPEIVKRYTKEAKKVYGGRYDSAVLREG